MAQKLNTDTSVVDYLKSTGSDSSFEARSKLAVDKGIVKNSAEYYGTAKQNVALLGALRGGASSSAPQTETARATAMINADQDAIIARGNAENDAPTRAATVSDDYSSAYETLSDMFMQGNQPEAPSYEKMYGELRADYNMNDLEEQMNRLQDDEEAIYAQLRQRRTNEQGKPVAMNVIEGRIGEAERQEMERIDYLSRQKNTVARQLQAANSAIENIMSFRKMDYDAARSSYNDQFSQQMQMFNAVRGVVDAERSAEERASDNARANLNIIYDSIKTGGTDVATMTPEMEYTVNTLELQAGLPTGFYNNIAKQNPDQKVLSTTTRTSSGQKYADVIMQGEDGSLSVKQVSLGAADTTSANGDQKWDGYSSESERNDAYTSLIRGEMSTVVGQDGYMSPENYKKARTAWSSKTNESQDDFDKVFAKQFVNPDHSEDYGVPFDMVINL